MNQRLISIIVPVYNVRSYVEKCLDSLLSQTYEKLEIICVDDGSYDGSESVLDQYACMDSRIRVFHQENMGVSCARNKGLDMVRGEYFGFVDPDDYVDSDMYLTLLEAIEKDKADISCGSYFIAKKDGLFPTTNKRYVKTCTMKTRDFLKYVYRRDYYKGVGGYIGTRLFRTERFKNSDNTWTVRFNPQIKYGEGTLFLAECMMKARNMVYVDKPMYYYVKRETSAMHNYEKIVKNLEPLAAYENIISLLKKAGISWTTVIWVKRIYTFHASLLAEYAEQIGWHDNDEKIREEMKKYLFEYILTNLNYPGRILRIWKLMHSKGIEKVQ